ncbi:MAG: zinc-finger domain-containing protein [Steroidobacteraceae bacterium]
MVAVNPSFRTHATMGAEPQPQLPANSQTRYEVRRADLPLSCPMPQMYLWNSHPRVYLPIEETGAAVCPYCGAEYVLTD